MTTENQLTQAQQSGRADALHILLEASARLLRRPTTHGVLSEILRLAQEVFHAAAFAVWRAYDGGYTWRVLMAEGLSESYRKELVHVTRPRPVQTVVAEDVFTHPDLMAFHQSYQAEGICSMIAVPMIMEGEVLGTVTLYFHSPQHFSEVELQYAGALANFAASALYTSELHDTNQREQRRLSFLAEASAVLASSLEYEDTLERVARMAVPHVADWCTVHILEGDAVTRVAVAHADPAMLSFAEQFSLKYPERLTPDRGMGRVLRTGESELYSHIPAAALAEIAKDEEHLRMMRHLGITAGLIVPLKIRGRVLGAIRMFAAQPERRFDEHDLRLAEDLARRAAIAIDNATLHEELRMSESNLRLSHAAAKMGSWSWDLVRNDIHWSDEFKQLHGLPVDTPSGFEHGASLVHPEDRERVMAELSEVLASDADEVIAEHRAITADGRVIWIYSRGRIERDPAGKAVSTFGISMDVTERRQAEEVLRRTEKLAAAGRLAATVAHEINNPLEAVTNLVYLARIAENTPPEVERHLRTAEQQLQRVEQIAKQTLGFYRESALPQPTRLAAPMEEIAELYRLRFQAKDVSLVQELEPELVANVVPGEVKQVMANLLSNALDATPPGGRVRVSLLRVDGSAEIRVSDSGKGIPEQDRQRLFEPFFTTKADVGTGLGLWVTKGIVEKYGGDIQCRSEMEGGSGATFVLHLPLIQDALVQESANAAQASDGATSPAIRV